MPVLSARRVRSDLLLPVMLFLAATAWLAMLVFFDAVFVTLALWTFGPVMSES